jgi:hypothetical protein
MKRSNILIGIGIAVVSWLAILSIGRALYGPAPLRWINPPAAGPLWAGSLRETDGRGDIWQLNVASTPQRASADPNGPKPGPPILVKTDVRRVGSQVSIGLVLEGQAGERYRPVTKNGRTVAAPRLRIVNEAGQEIGNGRFAYG